MSTITDVRGQEVRVGDTLAVATAGYNHKPELRVGQVLGFSTSRSNTTGSPDLIDMMWDAGSGDARHMVGVHSRIDGTLGRFAIVRKFV
jgi:hypothetical protein